jgi:hypothetical protein
MNGRAWCWLTLVVVLSIAIKMYVDSDAYNLKCVISRVDGETYCVRERARLHEAANLLATVTQRCKRLVEECGKRHPANPDIARLVERFDATRISETLPTSEHTAYSENKGEKIAFCVHKEKGGTQLIDMNTLTFVAIHELAHIMTASEGHKQIFWENFKFLLQNAVDVGIYSPSDYKETPAEYCGMTISDNPYYDM